MNKTREENGSWHKGESRVWIRTNREKKLLRLNTS